MAGTGQGWSSQNGQGWKNNPYIDNNGRPEIHAVSEDFYFRIARGLVSGHTFERKFGHNDTVGTTAEVIWDAGGAYNWLASAQTLNISSSSTDDAAGGTGALTLLVLGLDANFNLQEEIVVLNGQTIVTTANTYRRVYRLIVATEGSSEDANAGDISVFTGTETNGVPDTVTQVYAQIVVAHGQTLMTPYTIPANKTGYLLSGWATSGAGKNAVLQFFARPFGGAKNIKFDFDILDTEFIREFRVPLAFPAKTDIWVEAKIGAGTTKVSAGFDMILVDD